MAAQLEIQSSLHLHIQYRSTDSLSMQPRNPRLHSKAQVRQIAKSISNFGFVSPVLIDATGCIIAGHGRVMAARELKLQVVPTLELKHLTAAQVQALLIADNKLAMNATWDESLLAVHFEELATLDLDLSLTGFSCGEIDVLLDSRSTDPADDVPLPDPGPPITRPGDIWCLGRHRVFCGDALARSSYVELMGKKRARCIIADVPYNVRINGHVSGLGAIKHREFAMGSGEMSPAEFVAFLSRTFENLVAASLDGALHYIFIDWRHLSELLAAGEANFSDLINLAVWDKGSGGMGSFLRSQHELVLIWKSGSAAHVNNIELGRHGRYRTNIWNYPGMNSFAGRSGEASDLLSLHPTVKPIALVADAVCDCSARGDIVLDPFLGSGTTLLAAERVGRLCYAMEIDPIYVDVAIRRWQRLTGDNAVRADGVTFSQAEVTRG